MKKILMCTFFIFLIVSCKANALYPDLGFEVPSAIFIEGKVYWEKETVIDINDAVKIGEVKNYVDEKCLPTNEFMVSFSGKSYVGKDIYKNSNDILVEYNNAYHKFVYNSHMDLGEAPQDKLDKEEVDAIIAPGPGGSKPHYIFENMRYILHRQTNDHMILKNFDEVGRITKETSSAYENLEGVNINGILYADKLQNRYMIVKNKNDDKLYFYENESYFCIKNR